MSWMTEQEARDLAVEIGAVPGIEDVQVEYRPVGQYSSHRPPCWVAQGAMARSGAFYERGCAWLSQTAYRVHEGTDRRVDQASRQGEMAWGQSHISLGARNSLWVV